jgi:hypothetical protein
MNIPRSELYMSVSGGLGLREVRGEQSPIGVVQVHSIPVDWMVQNCLELLQYNTENPNPHQDERGTE